jgi:hypothetical protein
MFESLFGAEMPLPVRFFIAFLIVLGLIGLTAWIVRRFGAERLGAATARGRQPRLAVIDAAAVDGRRRLILIRRDNVEHLLMIGGPSDVVIEPNIVRATAAPREAPPPARAADALPRAVTLNEGSASWPLQPEPAAPARPQRVSPAEEPASWPAEPELPAPPPRRQPRPADPLAGLAAELTRAGEPRIPMPSDLGGAREPRESIRARDSARERDAEREPVREREPPRMREPQTPPAAPAEPPFDADADQNLADMAQRLEAALRRPGKPGEPRPPESAPRAAAANAESAPPSPAPARSTTPAETSPARADAKPGRSLYDSLEKEMASLLGRPGGKS